MKNKREERIDTRQRILEESSKLFAEKGYSATGIDEIAKKVGITKSVIYYHFKNKQDILNTLVQLLFEELIRIGRSEEHIRFHTTGLDFKDVIALIKETLQVFATEMNNRILKIVLLESVKESGDTLLFEFWDLGATQHQDINPDHLRRLWTEDPLMVKSFFLFFLPIIGFMVFRERWCEYYQVSSAQAQAVMVEGMEEYFTKIIRPQLENDEG